VKLKKGGVVSFNERSGAPPARTKWRTQVTHLVTEVEAHDGDDIQGMTACCHGICMVADDDELLLGDAVVDGPATCLYCAIGADGG
jgi:hypothetical protein